MMNNKLYIYTGILLLSVTISAISQILLKISAGKTYKIRIFEYLNPLVIIAYSLFVVCTLLTMTALKVVPLSMAGVIEIFGYVLVMILGICVLKEKISLKKLIGSACIIIGVIIYSLQTEWYVF